MVKKINEAQFEEVRNSAVAVVDFSAVWCGPCKMLAPVLEEVAGDLQSQVNFFNVDVDECQNLAGEFGIMSVPCLILFKDGVKVDQAVGFQPREAVAQWIRSHL